jgi:hypothetical protein
MFMRLAFMSEAYPGSADRYLASVCRALTQKNGAPPAKVAFDFQMDELRPMASVQQDGIISQRKVSRFGPVACPR